MNPSHPICWVSVLAMACVSTASVNAQPSITTKSLPIGTFGTPYSAILQAAGGEAPYTWSVTRGKLPSGLELNPTTGVIAGIPSASVATAGETKLLTFLPLPLIFQAQDSTGLTATATLPINVANPIVIGTKSLSEGIVGVPYSFCLSASGGALAYNGGLWKLAGGTFPERISLNQAPGCRGGLLSGAPSKAGIFSVQISVADFQGRSAQTSFLIRITGRPRKPSP